MLTGKGNGLLRFEGHFDLLADPVVRFIESADAILTLQLEPLLTDEHHDHIRVLHFGAQSLRPFVPGGEAAVVEEDAPDGQHAI